MKTESTLYELTEEYLRLQMWMEEEDADEDEALAETLSLVGQDFDDKADGYGMVIKNLEARIAVLTEVKKQHAEEAKRIGNYITQIENNIARMEDSLLHALTLTGKKNLTTEKFVFGSRKSSSVVVDAENVFEIPDDLLRYRDPEPDKTAIKDWLKNHPDENVSWAHIETKTALTLK